MALERHLPAVCAAKIDRLQCTRTLLKLGLDSQDDPVLVQLGEDGGDLPLAEGVIEGIVDQSAA